MALSGFAFVGLSRAVHFPIQRVQTSTSTCKPGRGPCASFMKQGASLSTEVTNTGNDLYTAQIKVAQTTFTLQLDTGSSDLWFSPEVPGKDYDKTFADAKRHNIPVDLCYGTGWASGTVATIGVNFAGFNIENQAFLYVQELSEWDCNHEQKHPIYQGIVGLGFETNSEINSAVRKPTTPDETWGRTLMANIFQSNSSIPKHIAFFLDRTEDGLSDVHTGYFDIGTYLPKYEAVADQPKLEVFSVYKSRITEWSVLVNGISINGKKYILKSSIVADERTGFTNVPPEGSIAALMDTGTSMGELPTDIYHALYKGMGGVYDVQNDQYAVPCMAEANLEFTIGDQTVSVHPLDLTYVTTRNSGGQEEFVCYNSYGPGEKPGSSQDIIAGDAFLRNVYAVYNYGDSDSTWAESSSDPFIQILPLTNAEEASAEFKQVRAKTLAKLASQVDVSTINELNPQGMVISNPGSTSAPSQPKIEVGDGCPNAAPLVFPTASLATGGDSGLVILLSNLTAVASAGFGPVRLSILSLIVLVALGVLMFARMRQQRSIARVDGRVPFALGGEPKNELARYGPQFRD